MTHILIEGLDLAGKSTACRGLLDQLDPAPEFRRNALSRFNHVYDFADDLRKADSVDGSVLGSLYQGAVELDLQRGERGGDNLIQDSTVTLRSWAYYKARGQHAQAKAFRKLLWDRRHPVFDATIVLTASIDVRQQRLKSRQAENPEEVAPDDLLVLRDPKLFLRTEKHLITEARRRFGADVIDTTHMTKQGVVHAVTASVAKQIDRAMQASMLYSEVMPVFLH